MEEVATAVKKIRDAGSLKEAEDILLKMNVLPETRLVDVVEYLD